MEVYDVALRLTLGWLIGCSIGLTGVGGGVLVMPALTVVLGFPATAAIGTATTFSWLSKVYAIIEHQRLGNIRWRVGLRILAGALPAAAGVSAWIAGQSQSAEMQRTLGWLITAVIAVAAAMMLLKVYRQNAEESAEKSSTHSDGGAAREKRGAATGDETEAEGGAAADEKGAAPWWLTVGLGALIGGLIGSTSVGGGVIVMPILVFAFPMTMRRVVGTAILISLAVSAVASMMYGLSAETSSVDFATAGWMVVGSLLGVRLGSRLTERLDDKMLTAAAVAMILLSVAAMTADMLTN